jgi:hypothetical protein
MVAPSDFTKNIVNSGVAAAADYITAKLTPQSATPNASGHQTPISSLESLEIDPDLISTLTPLFTRAGFHIKYDEVSDPSGVSRKLVIVTNSSGVPLYLISVHKCVLDQFTNETFSAFSMLTYLFGQNLTIHIISRDLDAMDVGFDSILQKWEQSMKIKAIFIPWKWMARLLGENDGNKRYLFFQQIFKIEGSTARTAAASTSEITGAERDQILAIMSSYAKRSFLNPQEAMQHLVLRADFPDPKTFEAAWKDDLSFNSLRLLKFAKDDSPLYPANHSRKGQSTLGWLLKALYDQPIDSDEKKILAAIILDHRLITEPEVIANLKEAVSR